MTALVNNIKQLPVIGRQSKNWQILASIINLDAFNGSNTAHGADRAYSGAFYVLNADIDAINQVEATDANSVDNRDASALSGTEDTQSPDKENDALAKKTRQRVSGMLLRAVVLQTVIVTIWLLV